MLQPVRRGHELLQGESRWNFQTVVRAVGVHVHDVADDEAGDVGFDRAVSVSDIGYDAVLGDDPSAALAVRVDYRAFG